jgi:hypothetical protein
MVNVPIYVGYNEFFNAEVVPNCGKFYEVANRILSALNAFTLNTSNKSKIHTVVRTLCMTTAISFHDVALLVCHGCGMGANKITRTAFEAAVNAEYLRRNPDQVQRFLDWSWVSQHNRAEYMHKRLPDAFVKIDPMMIAESEANFERVKPQFLDKHKKLLKSWYKLNLRQRADNIGFDDAYAMIYVLGSDLSHGSMAGIAQHIESFHEGGWQPALPPSLIGCQAALQAAHWTAFRALETLVELEQKDSTPPMKQIRADYDYAWLEE